MTVNLGISRRIDIDTSRMAAGLPMVAELTEYERMIARIPNIALWVDPGNAPADASALLRDRRAGYRANKKATDVTTVITPGLVNGLPGIVFDGSDTQGIAINGFQVPTDAYTVVSVCKLTDAGAANIVGGQTVPTNRFNFTFNTNGMIRLDHGTTFGLSINSAASAMPIDGSAWAVVWGSYSQALATGAVGKDSTTALASGPMTSPHAASRGIYLGALGSANTGAFSQGETFILNRASHIAADTQGVANLSALLALLKERYGIA